MLALIARKHYVKVQPNYTTERIIVGMGKSSLSYIKSAERWQRYGEDYHEEARKSFAEVNKSALTVATLMFGFIGIFLQNPSVANQSLSLKMWISASVIFLLISLLSGIALLFASNTFLNLAGDYYEKLSERMHLWVVNHDIATGSDYPKEVFKGLALSFQMNNVLSWAQLIFLVFSVICTLGYFFNFLY